MPRKAKENEKNVEVKSKVKEPKAVTKQASSKTNTKKSATTAKVTSKKTVSKKTTATKAIEKKASSKTATKKKTSTKKSSSTKSQTKKVSLSKVNAVAVPAEYYDLPYRYDQTVVKVLAQTPKSLFVYWDISNSDRQSLLDHFGENFFNDTIPFLRIINENNNYSFDVEVDDFANGWYVSVPNAKVTYKVLLYRKQRPFRNKIVDREIYLSTSNNMEAPNDHILFEKSSPTIVYKNVKTGRVTKKTIPFNIYRKSQNAIYGLYEYYKEIYQNEDLEEVFNLNNPSSSNPTSSFK